VGARRSLAAWMRGEHTSDRCGYRIHSQLAGLRSHRHSEPG